MARSTNLSLRRSVDIDAETIVVGAVGPGTRGRAAATRTGSAMLLTTRIDSTDEVKAILAGQSSSSSGGYLLQFAHVPSGGVIADAAGWTTFATLSVSGVSSSEAILSGKQVRASVTTAATTGAAVTVSVLNTNVVTLTIGAHTYQIGDYVTVSGMTSAGVPMNGTYAVTAIAATTISYAKTNANIADGGTAGLVYPGKAIVASTDEIRVNAVRAVAGTGSNGASAPAGTNTLFLAPCY